MNELNNANTNTIVNPRQVIEGISSVLTMFEVVEQRLFPREIMCGKYNRFVVNSEQEMLDAFRHSDYLNCRICAYPVLNSNNNKSDEGELLIPNLIQLELDIDRKLIPGHSKKYALNILKIQVNDLIKKLALYHTIYNMMIMFTGNGYHILIPFRFDTPFEKIKEFLKYTKYEVFNTTRNEISRQFLIFAKEKLGNRLADPANNPSFRMLLRCPGTINDKYGECEIVKIEHNLSFTSDGIESIPTLENVFLDTRLFLDFQMYLEDIRLKDKIKSAASVLISNKKNKAIRNSNNQYSWIELLHDKIPVDNCRRRIIWLILSRYAINIKHMSIYEARTWIREWTSKCNDISSLADVEQKINSYLDDAIKCGKNPISLKTLKSNKYGEWLVYNEKRNLADVIITERNKQ